MPTRNKPLARSRFELFHRLKSCLENKHEKLAYITGAVWWGERTHTHTHVVHCIALKFYRPKIGKVNFWQPYVPTYNSHERTQWAQSLYQFEQKVKLLSMCIHKLENNRCPREWTLQEQGKVHFCYCWECSYLSRSLLVGEKGVAIWTSSWLVLKQAREMANNKLCLHIC